MSWEQIAPLSKKPSGAAVKVDVEFAVTTKPGCRVTADTIVLVTVRSNLLELCPDFLMAGNRFKVMIGQGEHLGMIRFEAGVDYIVGKSGGPHSAGVLMLRFRRPDCIKAETFRGAAEYDYSDDWLEVSIPRHAIVPVKTREMSKTEPAATLGASRLSVGSKSAFASVHSNVLEDVRRGS